MNRRMFHVFLWCVLLPAILTVIILFLVKFKLLPHQIRKHLDWLILIMPLCYSLYILSFEVIIQIPTVFKKGGIASALVLTAQENKWRDETLKAINHAFLGLSSNQWRSVVYSFKMDLIKMGYRAKYLTVLSGAVFFLLMQGIDSLTGELNVPIHLQSSFSWMEISSWHLYELTGLGLFLVILYLSESQTAISLKRYLHCAELILLMQESRDSGKLGV